MVRLLDAARAVWNGPFYIGKIEKPARLGDVALKVLETLWRGSILVAGVFALAVLVAFGLEEARRVQSNNLLRESLNRDPSISEDGRIKMTVTYPQDTCSADIPIHISFRNLSNDQISWYRFSFSAHFDGRSSNLVSGDPTASGVSDYIIGPRGTRELCHAVPVSLNGRMGGERVSFLPRYVSTSR